MKIIAESIMTLQEHRPTYVNNDDCDKILVKLFMWPYFLLYPSQYLSLVFSSLLHLIGIVNIATSKAFVHLMCHLNVVDLMLLVS